MDYHRSVVKIPCYFHNVRIKKKSQFVKSYFIKFSVRSFHKAIAIDTRIY